MDFENEKREREKNETSLSLLFHYALHTHNQSRECCNNATIQLDV